MSWLPGRVTRRTRWDDSVWSLFVHANGMQPHKPGQWTNLSLDQGDERIKRAYSIASAPGPELEFLLVKVEGGALSPRLHALNEGDALWVAQMPLGFFTLDEVPDARDLWLLATGTGLGPFLAMLRTPGALDRFETTVLVHGVRHAAHLAYRDELAAMAPRLRYLPLVTREDAPGTTRARIGDALTDGRLEAGAGLTLSADSSHVMLCGNPDMVQDVTELLKARGLRKHRRRKPGHITTEAYW